jgi:hypothetical protein
MNKHYKKLHLPKPHCPTTKAKNKLIYNYCATIPWVLQLLWKYPLEIQGINKLIITSKI